VTVLIAVCGIAAVGVTWWLARDIGGPVAGLVAGLTMAVSATAIDESTFIWNPNLIALSSAVALAAAWRAWTTRRPMWWLVAAVATAVTMQCHVLGVTLLPVIAALLVADARSRPAGPERHSVWVHGLAGLGIIALSFAPLVVHELTTDFSEVNAALAYLRNGGDPATLVAPLRAVVIGLRVLSWPLTGLITDGFVAGMLATGAVIFVAFLLARRGTVRERQAARWLGAGLAWTVLFLTFASPSLAAVVAGLPNDHYHAFADPMVFVLVGVGAGVLWRGRVTVQSSGANVRPGRAAVVVAVGVLLVWNLGHQPPAVSADGGFPAAERAAMRIAAAAGGAPLVIRSLPGFKSADAYAYPLARAGVAARSADPASDVPASSDVKPGEALVVICDELFTEAIGASCDGPAEAAIAPGGSARAPILRFEAAPGRFISVYSPAP
jgi:hypothetical protein